MRIAIYARRSEEKETGESIETQLKICKQYAQIKYPDSVIEEYYDDDFSGKNINRPSFTKMMKLIKNGCYSILIFWKLDRISRSALDFLSLHKELEKIGVNMISVTEGFDPSTPAGKLMMIMLAAVAEMERKNISLRVTTVMNETAKKGRWSGGNVPLGYKAIKIIECGKEVPYLVEDEKMILVVEKIFEKYLNNDSLHGIARFLKEKYNIKKTPIDLKRLLQNPVYVIYDDTILNWYANQDVKIYNAENNIENAGLIRYGRQDFTSEDGECKNRDKKDWIIAVGKHKGIINSIDFIKAHDKVESAKRGRLGTGENTFLNPLVHCAKCGSYMRIRVLKRNGKN